MNYLINSESKHWVRSEHGWIAGVCEGLSHRLGIDASLLRIIWVASVFVFGTGALLYLILAICLPREDKLYEARHKRFLGVCQRLSLRSGIDIGLIRVLMVLLAFLSFGGTVLVYLVLHFVLADEPENDLMI